MFFKKIFKSKFSRVLLASLISVSSCFANDFVDYTKNFIQNNEIKTRLLESQNTKNSNYLNLNANYYNNFSLNSFQNNIDTIINENEKSNENKKELKHRYKINGEVAVTNFISKKSNIKPSKIKFRTSKIKKGKDFIFLNSQYRSFNDNFELNWLEFGVEPKFIDDFF